MTATERIRKVTQETIAKQKRHPMGHGFVWVELGNGKRFVAGSIDGRLGHDKILDRVKEETGVKFAWINLD